MKEKPKNAEGQDIEAFLQAYSPKEYDRPSVTLDIAIFTPSRELLMIQRANHPNIGLWALPGGFLEMDESLYDGAARELYEETNLKNIPMEALGMFGDVSRDPRTRIITAAFCAMAPREALQARAGDDAAAADVFGVEIQSIGEVDIPMREDRHPEISLPCTAYGEPLPDRGCGYELILTNKSGKRLSAKVARAGKSKVLLQTPCCEKTEGIAGDHALIIFSGLGHFFPFEGEKEA